MSKLLMVDASIVRHPIANKLVMMRSTVVIIQAGSMKKKVSKLIIASASTKVSSEPCIKNLRNAHEEVVRDIVGGRVSELLVNGSPKFSKLFAFPKVQD